MGPINESQSPDVLKPESPEWWSQCEGELPGLHKERVVQAARAILEWLKDKKEHSRDVLEDDEEYIYVVGCLDCSFYFRDFQSNGNLLNAGLPLDSEHLGSHRVHGHVTEGGWSGLFCSSSRYRKPPKRSLSCARFLCKCAFMDFPSCLAAGCACDGLVYCGPSHKLAVCQHACSIPTSQKMGFKCLV